MSGGDAAKAAILTLGQPSIPALNMVSAAFRLFLTCELARAGAGKTATTPRAVMAADASRAWGEVPMG